MNALSEALIIQVILVAILFGFLFYFMSKNSELKKEIESKRKNSSTNVNGD